MPGLGADSRCLKREIWSNIIDLNIVIAFQSDLLNDKMNSLPSKGIKRVVNKHLLLTIIHDGDGNAFAGVAQLPGFRHIKVQPGGPIRLACIYLIRQIRVTCVTHGA